MIRHIVMLRAAPEDTLDALMGALAGLVGEIDGFTGFSHGRNIDAEGKSPDYRYGFVCEFEDEAALHRYACDGRHQTIGADLVALCEGGADGIMVYDLKVNG